MIDGLPAKASAIILPVSARIRSVQRNYCAGQKEFQAKVWWYATDLEAPEGKVDGIHGGELKSLCDELELVDSFLMECLGKCREL